MILVIYFALFEVLLLKDTLSQGILELRGLSNLYDCSIDGDTYPWLNSPDCKGYVICKNLRPYYVECTDKKVFRQGDCIKPSGNEKNCHISIPNNTYEGIPPPPGIVSSAQDKYVYATHQGWSVTWVTKCRSVFGISRRFDDITKMCVFECTRTGVFGIPPTCNRYMQCSQIDSTPIIYFCPRGMTFVDSERSCRPGNACLKIKK